MPSFQGLTSVELRPEDYDCVVIVTAHSAIDYAEVVERSDVVVDFRNATGELGAASRRSGSLQRGFGPRARATRGADRPRIGQAGLGYWGTNLVRNFDELAELTWLCDADPSRRSSSRAATRERG